MKTVRKAVIPAAGLGTRVLPASKAMPKEMLPIVDKPAIQSIVTKRFAAAFPIFSSSQTAANPSWEIISTRPPRLRSLGSQAGKKNGSMKL